MDDTDTETVELSRSEARIAINALSEHLMTESGRDERRALNIREFLQREFGFEEGHFEADRSMVEAVAEVFEGDDREQGIRLSRAEAAEIAPALAEYEADSPDEAETIARLRGRLEETFELTGHPGA